MNSVLNNVIFPNELALQINVNKSGKGLVIV